MQVASVAPDWPGPSLMHRRRVVEDRITYVGLDVHKEGIVVAVAEGGFRGEVREYGRIANTPAALEGLGGQLTRGGGTARLWHPTPFVGVRASMRRGRPVADPKAAGRPGENGSAGCGQSGPTAP